MAEMTTMTSLLEVAGLEFSYGNDSIVQGFELTVDQGEIVALMGPSGCGKTTLLRLLTGLESSDSGRILFRGSPIFGPPPGVFLGFQDFDAFPWLTVEQNVLLATSFRFGKKCQHDVQDTLTEVGLEAFGERFPGELSGGMRKRLAFARCLASAAQLVLLDEPFASLDVASRIGMQHLLRRVVIQTNCATILVTHDAEEAVFLADRVVLCQGPPLEVTSILEVDIQNERSEEFVKSKGFERKVVAIREHFGSKNECIY